MTVRYKQGCWWNERSLNRAWIAAEASGSAGLFFLIHVRSSKSTRHFKFRTNSVSVSPRSCLKRSRSSSIAFEANTHPAHQPTPKKILDWCVSQGFPGLLVAHVHMLFDISHILRVRDYFPVLLPVGSHRGVVRILWILNLKGIKNLIIVFICKHKCFYV